MAFDKKASNSFPRSKTCPKFYLHSKAKLTLITGFSKLPYCNQKVGNTTKDICATVHLNGKFTDYSLPTTSARRIFDQDVNEHIIKSISSHKSECVRTYKFTSNSIRKHASNVFSSSR